jgi:hypothetical protein
MNVSSSISLSSIGISSRNATRLSRSSTARRSPPERSNGSAIAASSARCSSRTPPPLNERRPEQTREREREILITVIVNLLPRIERAPPTPNTVAARRAFPRAANHEPPSAAPRA